MNTLSTQVAARSVEQLHPSLAFRARLGSLSISWGRAALCVDLGMLLFAAGATELGASAGGAAPPTVATVGFIALSVGLLQARNLYAPRLVPDTLEDTRILLTQVTVAGMAMLALLLLGHLGSLETLQPGGLIRLWGFSAVYLVAGRVALAWSQTQARRRGEAVSPTFIVGRSDVARLTARRLLGRPELGLLPVGYVAPGAEPARVVDEDLPIPVVGCTADMARLAEQFDVTQVIVTASGGSNDEELFDVIERCEELGISVAYVPAVHERIGKNLRVEHIGALPIITSFKTDPKGWQFAIKYGFDRIVAAVILLLLAPVLLACAAAVYFSMGRPILFRQVRVGVDGEQIGVLKFRTMRAPKGDVTFRPEVGKAPGGVEGEDRRTPVGTFLRKTSLDELPQLINVLLGQMSLVGPRPERPEYVSEFSNTVRRYDERHRVRAGITGWAQVQGLRGQTSIEDRAEWDNWYIENFSLWLDLKIMLLTFAAVFRYARQGE